ncbi:response regulator transcription factor [Bacillus sp. UNCCL81]|uniref:response regulator transcription factor n=1 Tax=Bacillus sp. UNCCL81 TaxID=1502755 RepID=UPI0008EB55D9|nr:response regulator transcription factor [Bacillus sp. UNCCL81]SFD38449.1 DNA-binding response regulator, OmpR family, contains REC and winged-helix (wHTH) domain [Bacillus sp. UNCCL81]
MKKILIIEDEVNIARVLKLEIEYEGFEVLVEHNGKAGLESALSNNVDLILLDVMLPELSGIEVLRRIRKTNQFVPVILLTARDATHDKIIGLDYGANDYITKPFEIEEVLARIRSSLRSSNLVQEFKKNEDSNPILAIEDLVVNLEAREVKRNDKVIPLTPKEYDLLVYLLENQNKIVTREGIITTVWGYEYEGETNVVDVYIRHLRKKIEEDFDVPLIRTIRGVGYTMRKA